MAAILRGLGVKAGDDVLIQAFTCIAVPEAVLSIGARPRYVDVTPETPNMDAADLARKIRPETKAIVIQHSFGLPADVVPLTQVANDARIPVVEDCAHTVASSVDGRLVGSFGAGAFYSYEASKPVFIGIGGSAVSNDPALTRELAKDYFRFSEPTLATQLQLRAMFHAHGIAYRPSTYWTIRRLFRALVSLGVIRGNYNEVTSETGPSTDFSTRMGKTQARLLDVALRSFEKQTEHRRWVAQQYRSRIRNHEVSHIPVAGGMDPVYGRYPMMVQNKDRWVEHARDARVELADFYVTPVHPLKGDALRTVGYEPGSCPNAERMSASVVSLPTGRQTTQREIDRAVDYFNG
jgi:perosamine synthetase